MTKIICRQCKKEFSKNTIINGKKRFLGNRKFCIECSPFGLNNRRSINPGVKGTARNSIPYAKLPEKRKNQVRMAVKRLGAKRKTKLIDMFGGKCKICNYSKCERALSFHHRDYSLIKIMIFVFLLHRTVIKDRSLIRIIASHLQTYEKTSFT
jgi:hypothetical protein